MPPTDINSSARASDALRQLAPGARPFKLVVPLADDESRWFVHAIDSKIVRFQECDPGCPRLRRRKASGPDEFAMRPGEFRHLFSAPLAPGQRLNREYIPHIAAYARAISDFGYDPNQSAFSRYRMFERDHITKRAGTGYETDAEFYDADGRIYLHVEAKTKPREVEAIARQLDDAGSLTDLPQGTRKEIEYVLELTPRFLWLVGPGTVDPAKHVFAVHADKTTARFERIRDIPPPSTSTSGSSR